MSNLRTFRLRALLTQDELAEKSRVSRTTIAAAERGEVIAVATKRKLLDGLSLPYSAHESVFGPVPEPEPREREQDEQRSASR